MPSWRAGRRDVPASCESAAASQAHGIILYHQTSPENAQAILQTGCMRPGPPGFGGSGIYFAADPQATTCKANHHGVILECSVRLGRVRHVCKAGDWSSRLKQWFMQYDSVALTFLEGGIEYVIYDPSRVTNIRVHTVLHTCSSSGSFSAGSSSGSFRIATAADPGLFMCSNSSQSDGSSNSSISGDSMCSLLCTDRTEMVQADSSVSCSATSGHTLSTASCSNQPATVQQLGCVASKVQLIQPQTQVLNAPLKHTASDVQQQWHMEQASSITQAAEQQQQQQQQQQQHGASSLADWDYTSCVSVV